MIRSLPTSRVIVLPLIGLLAALCPLIVLASPATAVLQPSANVRVNGVPVLHSTMLFSGDLVRTESSAVSLEMSGSGILLDKESTAILEDDRLSLICGRAVIKTLKALGARVGNLEIQPTSQSARFEIIRQQQNIRITALDGDLKILQENRKMELKAGRQLDLSCSQCSQETASAQSTNSSGQVDAAGNDFCDLPAALIAQPENGSTSIVAAVGGAVGPATLVWILLQSSTTIGPSPMSPSGP